MLNDHTGKLIDIADLTPEDAIALFGLPIYEAWLEAQVNPRTTVTYEVTKVDANTITLSVVDIEK